MYKKIDLVKVLLKWIAVMIDELYTDRNKKVSGRYKGAKDYFDMALEAFDKCEE